MEAVQGSVDTQRERYHEGWKWVGRDQNGTLIPRTDIMRRALSGESCR